MPLIRVPQARHIRRGLLISLSLVVALTLAACGVAGADVADSGGGGTPTESGAVLKIAPTTLPPASRGVPYDAPSLTVTGAQGPVTWTLWSGELPPGLELTTDGRLVGTPEESGFFEFTAEASDGRCADLHTFAIAVDTFGLVVADGLQFGDAWSAEPVSLACAGVFESIQFEVVVNQSGGRLESVDAAAGTAVYVPGYVATGVVNDVIRATDSATGESAAVELTVVPDPTDGHEARFHSTDVWYVDFQAKHGTHGYTSDWHAALAMLGLRDPDSTGPLGCETDRLADLATRIVALQYLNEFYLRERNGHPGAHGLAISFPLEAPGAGHTMPSPGSYLNAAANQYSVMTLCDRHGSTALGTAFIDAPGNPLQENNSPGGYLGSLGVYVNNVAYMARVGYRQYGSRLASEPVTATDLDALKACLYGQPPADDRADMICYVINALGRSVAYVAAHEIGHSLGLEHTQVTSPGAIMNHSLTFSASADYHFLPEDIAILRQGLPGPARAGGTYAKVGTGGAPVAASTLPQGGVCVCGHHDPSR